MQAIMIRLKKEKKTPLYQQLYQSIVEEIRRGNLKEGEKLPSKKALCAHLKISQSTVETAYEMLCAEGYIQARPRSGYYVCKMELLWESPVKRAFTQQEIPKKQSWRYDFSTGNVDTSVFPYSSWAKITRDTVYQNPQLLLKGDNQGDPELRRALAVMLKEMRGVHCDPAQIIVGAGNEYLLDLLVQILGDTSVFGLENPGYDRTYQIIQNSGRKVVPISIDDRGMRVEELEQSGANVAYVTPSHQFPSGVTMPAGRRTHLLKWAAGAPERYVIEDDYDSEFRSDTRPIPAIQGWDSNGKVVYLGTFSRSIAPSIRVAYLVLPPALMQVYQSRFWFYSSTVSRFEQHTLCRFLESGQYVRHLNRVGNLYKERKREFIHQLSAHLENIQVKGEEAGLHFLLTIKNGMSEKQLIEAAIGAEIRLSPYSVYFQKDPWRCPPATVVIGYAGLPKEEAEQAAVALADCWSIKKAPSCKSEAGGKKQEIKGG